MPFINYMTEFADTYINKYHDNYYYTHKQMDDQKTGFALIPFTI